LVVEVDGSIHDNTVEKDRQRDRILTEKGLRILHIRNEEIQKEMEGVLEKIQNQCESVKLQ